MPTIGMMGEFVKGGTSWLQLDTVEEWQPVPVLILPRLHGLLVLYANGTMKIDVEAWMDQWVIVPNFVEWVDVYVSVDVAPFNASGVEGVPDMVVFMRGGLLGAVTTASSRRSRARSTRPSARQWSRCSTPAAGRRCQR